MSIPHRLDNYHFPSSFKLNLYLSNQIYDWLEAKNSRHCLLNCGKYLVAIPFHIGMLILTPIAIAWDIIMILGYLLNSIFNCYTDKGELIGRLESFNHLGRHAASLFGGTLTHCGIHIIGVFVPPLANCLSR